LKYLEENILSAPRTIEEVPAMKSLTFILITCAAGTPAH